MSLPIIDIILPCYNPPPKWATEVVTSFNLIQLEADDFKPRLIIVNDGSRHGIQEEDLSFIQDEVLSFTWISNETNRGKGYALRNGVKRSTGDYIVLTDIDFPFVHESVMAIIHSLLNKEANVVAGERSQAYYTKTPLSRKIISKALKFVLGILLKLKVSDTQCGLKGMHHKVKQTFLDTTIDRYLYDVEFLWMAGKQFTIKAVPVRLKDNIVFSKVNANILFSEGINFVKIFFKTLF